ncbi:hypothetical protein [Stygiolobus azoricus]|uniref:hypothetical protein n=1 Tax=Stygiolobus azoricus TaxID=41675 RepID=UPI0018C89E99|nr:hypothetical protein [Stygiolobus azoricus]
MRTKEVYQPDGGNAPRVREISGDVSPVPLGSKETHDPPGRWLRAKSLHLIMNIK